MFGHTQKKSNNNLSSTQNSNQKANTNAEIQIKLLNRLCLQMSK